MYGQRANGGVTDTRYHIRARRTHDSDPTWGVTTTGTPHREHFHWDCGHSVDPTVNDWSGFDKGRRAIYNALTGVHTYGGSVNWGNTRQFQQCHTADWPGSNGVVGWWRMPYWTH